MLCFKARQPFQHSDSFSESVPQATVTPFFIYFEKCVICSFMPSWPWKKWKIQTFPPRTAVFSKIFCELNISSEIRKSTKLNYTMKTKETEEKNNGSRCVRVCISQGPQSINEQTTTTCSSKNEKWRRIAVCLRPPSQRNFCKPEFRQTMFACWLILSFRVTN